MTPVPLAICFDLDDTLWEVQPVLRCAEARVQAYLEAEHPQDRKSTRLNSSHRT